MDLASERARRKNRSSTNLNHLTLAPLTVKLPIEDESELNAITSRPTTPSTSYLQGKSAPTTPRLISRSPVGIRSHSHHRRTPSAPGAPVSKSKSTTHLGAHPHRKTGGSKSGTTTPNGRRRRGDDLLAPSRDRNDSDWLLRTGALMSTEAREYKGQAWLVSRQSSTSLAGMRDADEEAFEEELAHERELSRRQSRRGSSVLADDDITPPRSRFASRNQSRSHSMAGGPRSRLLTPSERIEGDSYFDEQAITGPDFVNLDEALEELEAAGQDDDEATVRKLVRRGQAGQDSWLSSVMGWSLFSVEENNEEDSDDDSYDEDAASQGGRSNWSNRHFEGVSNAPHHVPPPQKDEGGWKDAAWLFSVATKVMF